MSASIPLSPAKSYAERIAWMHEPVHLRCAFLPWFVRRMLEYALHRYFCRFEQTLLALMEVHQQGKLEPWPEEADEVESSSRVSKYKMKSTPAVPQRSAGSTAVPLSLEALPVAARGQSAVEVAPELGAEAAVLGRSCRVVLLPTALPRRAGSVLRQLRPWPGQCARAADRCRGAVVCRAAERGGKLASKSFRSFN